VENILLIFMAAASLRQVAKAAVSLYLAVSRASVMDGQFAVFLKKYFLFQCTIYTDTYTYIYLTIYVCVYNQECNT